MLLQPELKKTVTELTPYPSERDRRPPELSLGDHKVGKGHPVYIVAEVGINHNGSLERALMLIDIAADAGCDAVKFQKRSPEHCVPAAQRDIYRQTPWGKMTYLQYRHRMELGASDYDAIERHCRRRNIAWFASCWDKPSVDFIQQYNPFCYKIASACLTDDALLQHIRSQDTPVILSTGMSTMEEIRSAVSMFERKKLLVVHTTSNYTGNAEELNLSMIETLQTEFGGNIGYSGHEYGFIPSIATVSMGACYVERHITLDHCMWGSDHTISLEPEELTQMVGHIRLIEKALGDGIKRVYDSEKTTLAKLRNCTKGSNSE